MLLGVMDVVLLDDWFEWWLCGGGRGDVVMCW
jgi:hypothetical protein